MAEKISESSWTGFTKKHKLDLDDQLLVKALASFDKTSDSKPEPRLKALDGIIDGVAKQVLSLAKRTKELGDKLFGEVKDRLYELQQAAEKLQKELHLAEKASEAGDDDEESPALLTAKMIPLLREVRKGELVLQALIAVAGKETVVLLSRKPISPARGKLLKDQMSNAGGVKFIRAESLFEAGALTFVVEAGAAGLAKKIKAALLAQTELRLKVRVRGVDPDDVDEDGEEGGEEGDAAADVQPHQPPTDPLKLRFEARWAGLEPRLAAALRQGAGDGSKLRAVAAFAQEKAAAGTYAAGLQGLDALEKLLPGAAAPLPSPDPADAFKARLSALIPRLGDAPGAKLRASEAGALARKLDFTGAQALLDEVESLLGATAAPASGAGKASAAWGRWRAEQTQFAAALNEELAWVRSVVASKAPEAESMSDQLFKAELELKAVLVRTGRVFDGAAQAAEMSAFLADDDVVAAVCEYAGFDVQPMLAALRELESA